MAGAVGLAAAPGSAGAGQADRRPHSRCRGGRAAEGLIMDLIFGPVWIVAAVLLLFLLASALRVYREYERAVIFLLGRFWKVKGPGRIMVIPVIQQALRVDLRTRGGVGPQEDVMCRDNVAVKVNAVI